MARAGLLPAIRFDVFVLDEANAMLLRDGRRLELPPKAFDVLCELARQPGRLISKDALLDAVWGHRHISESVLKTTIGQIRSALMDDARAPRLIETVARRGYRFLPTPTRVDDPAPARQAGPGVEAIPSSAEPAHAPRPGSPAAPTGLIPTDLIGRRRTLAALDAAWRDASAGRRRIVWVSGEAGIGKTTLIDGFTATLDAGVRVIHGQCVEQIGAGEPYAPILDALAMLCRDEPEVATLMRTVAPTWLLQLPWLGNGDTLNALQRELTGATQGRMLRELAELLERHTAARPLLLVTEDLHWSDHATIQLLDHLARRRQPARLLWLASCRPADVIASGHPFSGLRHELRLHGLGTELALEPFSEQEVAAFLDARLPPGDRPPEQFVRRLHAHTDGLPLFVAAATAELLAARRPADGGLEPDVPGLGFGPRSASESDFDPDLGPARPDDWSGLALAAAPASLTGVIDRAIDRLAPGQIAILAVASLIGVEFRVRTVADAAGLDLATVRTTIDELVRRQQWLEARPLGRLGDGSLDEICAFRHSLYRHVFLQRIGAVERVDGHRRITASLTASRAAGAAVSAAELASHAEAGLMPVEAIGHLADAAQSALAHLAPVEAAHHAEAGLALLARTAIPAGERRDELELTLSTHRGTAHGQLKGLGAPEARASFERASALCDQLPATLPRAWFYSGIGWIHYASGDYPRARAHAGSIAAIARTSDDAVLRVCSSNLAGVTAIFEGRLAEGIAEIEQGLAAARGIDAALAAAPFIIDPVISMHGNVAVACTLVGDVGAALEHLRLADERSAAIGHPFSTMVALWSRCMLLVELEDAAALARTGQALEQVVSTHQIGQGRGPAHWFAAWLLARLGDPAALERFNQGHAFHDGLGMHAGNTIVHAYGADIALALDDAATALRQADAGLALATRIGEWAFAPRLLVAKARALARLGRPLAEREALFAEALAGAEQRGQRWGALLARTTWIEDGRRPEAAELAAIEDLLAALRGAEQAGLVRRARMIADHAGDRRSGI